jgi:hypothetical protein
MSISYIKNYATNSGGLIKITSMVAQAQQSFEFYAFITSFSDNMTSNWNEEQVYGRPDPIGTFQNTSRKISLGFDIPSKNLSEAKSHLDYIAGIKRFMYPAYSSTTTPASDSTPEVTTNALSLAKSPLVRLKFANLIQNDKGDGLLGWINSFSATPVIDMGMFNQGGNLYPKVYNATIDFTPQHEFDLGFKSTDGSAITGSFISFPYGG